MSSLEPQLDNDPVRELAVEVRAIHRALKLRVREHGGSKELTVSQMSVLARLEEGGGSTVSSLARAEGMRPQSMSEVVAPLKAKGLVGGSPDPRDGRQTLMSLTPKGMAWIREGKAASHDWLTTTISRRLTTAEQHQLGEALKLLRRVVEA